ncbi:acyl-CoA-binding domain-containing protein 4 isoform X2 [Cucumis melo var. makuwa]|uniref:Acyl-CoA-binding domain-containing protein 4 isoform X2 n=1 Tax=Cucumis melo var. makuwa TaxID=1194695 RepID=A0A5D3C6F7_CUCMM|nr:acyl-CoA-binding domain-containing protein 4 isoform X2 [Cucumis melo var. makuwa]TYK07477.1 acyl-CoA-binding domain-containing protein 4 isoform X2 [Cucumis melo var. makuwa]
MAVMVRASSGLQYPDRFYAAASYAGFDGSPKLSSKALRSKFSDEAALLLYGLYQQVLPRVLTPVTYRCCFSLVERFESFIFFVNSGNDFGGSDRTI